MFALHMPARALRLVGNFLRVEYEVVLRDGRRPFTPDEQAKVFVRRAELPSANRQLGPLRRVAQAPAAITGRLRQVTGRLFQVVLLRGPSRCCLALFESSAVDHAVRDYRFARVDLRSSRAPRFLELHRDELLGARRTVRSSDEAAGDGCPAELVQAVLAMSTNKYGEVPGQPGVVVVVCGSTEERTTSQGPMLHWVDVGVVPGAVPRVLRSVLVATDDDDLTLESPPACDAEGSVYLVCCQELGTLSFLKVCGRTGNTLASLVVDCPSAYEQVIPLAPGLWLSLSVDSAALINLAGDDQPARRPLPDFLAQLLAGSPGTASFDAVWRMAGDRLVIHEINMRGGRLLHVQVHRGPQPDQITFSLLSSDSHPGIGNMISGLYPPIIEGPDVEALTLPMRYDNTLVITAAGARLQLRVVNGFCVAHREIAEHAHFGPILRQALRQQERRVRAEGDAPAQQVRAGDASQ